MTFKLIAIDMDGTALRSDKKLSERTVSAICSAIKQGCLVVPTTGRVAKMLPKQVSTIRGIRYSITSNGASLIDLRDGSVMYSNLMTMDETNKIIRFVSDTGLLAEAYCSGVSYAEKSALDHLLKLNPPKNILSYIMESQIFVDDLPDYIASHNIPLEKINIPYIPDEFRDQLYLKLSEMKEYSICSSGLVNIEINSVSCSKGNALRHLCSELEISPSQVMAIGDSGNDVSMLQYAGFSVAMGNADAQLRSSADYITGTNDEDGAAYAIEKFVLTA